MPLVERCTAEKLKAKTMRALSLELRYLIYTAVLLAVIWNPYIVAHIAQVGPVVALAIRSGWTCRPGPRG